MLAPMEIRALAAEEGFPRLSLYQPTHRGGREVRQGAVHFRQLLRSGEERLGAAGIDASAVASLLEPARGLLDDDAFWQNRDLGLAVFLSPEGMRAVSAPMPFAAQAHLGSRFLLKPLVRPLMRDGLFYVLVAHQAEVALYRANRYGWERVETDRLPHSAAPFVESVQIDNAVGFHAASRGAGTVEVHASGESPQDEAQAQVEQFALRTAKATDGLLANETAPLVLAADDRLLGMLRRHIGYRQMLADGIREHPVSLGEKELHARAYELARPHLDAGRQDALDRLAARLGAGDGTASQRIEDIAVAAAAGRVDVLLLDPEAAVAGLYDAASGRALRTPAGGEDLVDLALSETLARGGTAYAHPAERSAELPAVAALYRY